MAPSPAPKGWATVPAIVNGASIRAATTVRHRLTVRDGTSAAMRRTDTSWKAAPTEAPSAASTPTASSPVGREPERSTTSPSPATHTTKATTTAGG
jgi:hypothetical protein